VKERRKGPFGAASELAGGMAAAMRRAQREREPRLLLYDESGIGRLLPPGAAGYDRTLEAAEELVALVEPRRREASDPMA